MRKQLRVVLGVVAALALAGTALAGGQQIAVEAAPDGGSLLVRTYRCGTPSEFVVTGVAEGVVGGQRQRIPLALARTSEPGVFSVARQWPSEGRWALTFTAEGKVFVNALVELQPGAALRIASQESTITRITRQRLDRVLERRAGS